jgi:hypothetical protein
MFKPAQRLAISLCGLFVLTAPAIAQAVDQQEATAGPAPLTQSAPPTESAPLAESSAQASEQPSDASGEASGPKLGQGTKAQAEHSAEATAHKSLNDPNNQLGTSLQGRTRPIVEANGSQTNPAAAVTPPEAGAQQAAQ